MNLTQIASKVAQTSPRTLAVVKHLKLKDDPDCFRQIVIGKSKFDRYSQKAVEKLQQEIPMLDMKNVWEQYGTKGRRPKRQSA
jgi:hypothetical protein